MKVSRSLLDRFPRVHLSVLPTPLHKLERLSRMLGRTIYCKRDDLTGFAFGGNKTRKLDFLIADALQQKCDSLVATGAFQSNFCRMAAAAGRACGLDVHLVLGGDREPEKPTGNLLLDHLFGAHVHSVASDEWNVLEDQARQLADGLTAQGRTVYSLPIGGSTPVGALGYVRALLEILDDCERLGLSIDTIIHATSSAGTQAGLLVGKALTQWHGRIIGMGVAKDTTTLSREIYELASRTAQLLGVAVQPSDVIVDHRAMGPTYGARTPACAEAIRLFAEQEGILLDNVYTGKAAAGLIEYVRRELFSSDETVLFLHTGGNIELFE